MRIIHNYDIIYKKEGLCMQKTFIFGHKKPDTDAVMSAVGLSYLKNQLGENTEPRVLGNINKETTYALNYFGIKNPKYFIFQLVLSLMIKVKMIQKWFGIRVTDDEADAIGIGKYFSDTMAPKVEIIDWENG